MCLPAGPKTGVSTQAPPRYLASWRPCRVSARPRLTRLRSSTRWCRPRLRRPEPAYALAPTGWLLLIGGNGCGKTHLAVAIARERLAADKAVLFLVVPDLLDHLRATYAPGSPVTYNAFCQQVREAELLVLDDLGSEQSSPWATEKLFQLLNHRYNAELPTVITTNRVGLHGIDHRLRSRLGDWQLVRRVNFGEAPDYGRQGERPSSGWAVKRYFL